jgi:hypothetical protein
MNEVFKYWLLSSYVNTIEVHFFDSPRRYTLLGVTTIIASKNVIKIIDRNESRIYRVVK